MGLVTRGRHTASLSGPIPVSELRLECKLLYAKNCLLVNYSSKHKEVEIGAPNSQTRRKDDFWQLFRIPNSGLHYFIGTMKHSGRTRLDKIVVERIFCTKDC